MDNELGGQIQQVAPKPRKTPWLFLLISAGMLIAAVSIIFIVLNHSPQASATSSTEVVAASSSDSGLPTSTAVSIISTTSSIEAPPAASTPQIEHVPLPSEVRGIYLTGYTFGSKRFDELLGFVKKSNLNTMVIDVKLDNGELVFDPTDDLLDKYVSKSYVIDDFDDRLTRLKDNGVYRIARIFVMRDGGFGKLNPKTALQKSGGGLWHDKTNTPWLDPAAPEVSDYAVRLAREVYARGFDEVQFDYVRFPTDGNLDDIRFPVYDGKATKSEVMKDFFTRVSSPLSEGGIPFSYDLYGMTFWRAYDFGIGQRLATAYPSSTAISPMVYPSHYPTGFEGFKNPAEHPYEIVKESLDKGVEVLGIDYPDLDPGVARKNFRPWIQDFDLGADYGPKEVMAQIKASRDAGSGGFLIWNARNVYTAVQL